jgi:hypothetical protein
VCDPFEAGFSYFLGVSLLSPKWHVTEKVFPKTWMAMLGERFPYYHNVIIS